MTTQKLPHGKTQAMLGAESWTMGWAQTEERGFLGKGNARGFVPASSWEQDGFPYSNALQPFLNNPVGYTAFYRWGLSGSEGLRNLPKVTQLKKMAGLSLKLCSFYHTMLLQTARHKHKIAHFCPSHPLDQYDPSLPTYTTRFPHR